MVISTVPDLSELRLVDMLTRPVAAVRAVVATGLLGSIEHDMYLIGGSVGTSALFYRGPPVIRCGFLGYRLLCHPVSTPG